MLNSVSTDSEAQYKLPRKPERPLDSDCCGQGCVPCVFDLYEEEVKIWEEECREVTERESKEFGQADCCIQVQKSFCFTCVALGKYRSSSASTPSIRPLSACPSTTLFGCPVCVICNYERFHFLISKLCIMIVHTLKMCTSYFVHIS